MNANYEKITHIIQSYTREIYLEQRRFQAIISDFFAGEEIGDLIKLIIENEGATIIYNYKDLEENDFIKSYNYNLISLCIATEIPKEKLTPAYDLLVKGILADFSPVEIEPEISTADMILNNLNSTPTLADIILAKVNAKDEEVELEPETNVCTQLAVIPVDRTARIEIEIPEPSPIEDFKIKNNVLVKYVGKESKVVIPDGIEIIGKRAFKHCEKITNITLPTTVVAIETSAFKHCKLLSKINLNEYITTIGDRAFKFCDLLSFDTIDYIKKVNTNAF